MAKPTRYLTDDEIKKLKVMAGLGMNNQQMAAVLDMSLASLERRIKEQKGVKEGLLKGRAESSANIRQSAYKMAMSGKHPAMTIFWLKTREGFKEAERDINLTVSQIPTDQLVAKAKEAIQYLEEHKADE